MKYEVTYSCGHTGTVELFGKGTDRENKLQWYKKYAKCPECYAKKKEEKLVSLEQRYELCDLIGSEKQIAWARNIREKKIIRFFEGQDKSVLTEQGKQFFDEYFGEKFAAKWIDRNFEDVFDAVAKFVDKLA